jgi:hypothetical protein
VILYFFHSATCHSCKVALPELNHLRTHRFDFVTIFREVDGLYSDAARDQVPGHSWRPRTTPGYAVTAGNALIDHHEGLMKAAQLSKWLDGCAAKIAAKTHDNLRGIRPPPPRAPGGKPPARTPRR